MSCESINQGALAGPRRSRYPNDVPDTCVRKYLFDQLSGFAAAVFDGADRPADRPSVPVQYLLKIVSRSAFRVYRFAFRIRWRLIHMK